MDDITDEGKRYRVACWLDALMACTQQLRELKMRRAELDEGLDGIGAVRYDKPSRMRISPDKVADMAARREADLAAISAEIDEVSDEIRAAGRIIRDARTLCAGHDAEFRYIVNRYVRGMRRDDAARDAGIGVYKAMTAVRALSCAIYDSAPEVFAGRRIAGSEPYGYREFATKKTVYDLRK